MKNKYLIVAVLTAGLILAALSMGAAADRSRLYEITITNITRGQIISPPIVFSHGGNINLFKLGEPASDSLARLAEDGMTAPLEADLLGSSSVLDVATATGGIPPGASAIITVRGGFPYSFLSGAGMLVSSNDAFFAVRNVRLPWGREVVTLFAEAYDAGSENNSESCDFVPGPPCGSSGERDTGGAEGYVHIHAGIQGVADLLPEQFDWRNPVALIRIKAVNEN